MGKWAPVSTVEENRVRLADAIKGVFLLCHVGMLSLPGVSTPCIGMLEKTCTDINLLEYSRRQFGT